jgi:hypothetical protein
MKAKLLLTCLLVLSLGLRAEDAHKGIPYNSVNTTMKLLDGRKMDGVDCVPFLVRTEKGFPTLVPADADFRIVTWEGKTVKLKCEPLDQIPAGELSEAAEDMKKKDGFTHVLWMPKNVKDYLDGSIHHSLPKGSVFMSQGLMIKRTFKLGDLPDPKKP